MSQRIPGYRFQYQVPPKSPASSASMMLSIPSLINACADTIPLMPQPVMKTSTSRSIGARSSRVGA